MRGLIARKLAGGLVAVGLLTGAMGFVTAGTAMAASGCQTVVTVTVTPSRGPGGTTVTITVTVKDCNGNGQAGVVVTVSQSSGPCQSTFASTTATTDSTGTASVTATVPKNCPGQYIFNANANGVNSQAAFVETGGFPFTGAAPPGGMPLGWLLLAVGLLAIVAGATATVMGRRSA